MTNIQHGRKRPHNNPALLIAVIVAGILSSLSVLTIGALNSWGEDKPERAVGHLVMHVAQPDLIPPCPKPRPTGTPVVP